jgi:hypothetical protein
MSMGLDIPVLVTSFPDNNRSLTFYGEEHSRLSRNQSVLWDPEQKHPWVSIITDSFTFHTSNAHRARLDDIFVDHMVYADRWAQLIGDSLRQWRASGFGVRVLDLNLIGISPQRRHSQD